jgi:hypothetical protein
MAKKKRFLSHLVFSAVAFLVLGLSAHAQTSSSFKVTGPCVNCGSEYLETIVMKINGVKKASYDQENFQLSLQYDAEVASELDIQLELSLKGYDAGGFGHDATAALPACARNGGNRGDDALGDLEDEEEQVDWESPKNLAELETLGRRGDDDSEIDDDVLLIEETVDDSEELMNWEPVADFEDEEEDGNP